MPPSLWSSSLKQRAAGSTGVPGGGLQAWGAQPRLEAQLPQQLDASFAQLSLQASPSLWAPQPQAPQQPAQGALVGGLYGGGAYGGAAYPQQAQGDGVQQPVGGVLAYAPQPQIASPFASQVRPRARAGPTLRVLCTTHPSNKRDSTRAPRALLAVFIPGILERAGALLDGAWSDGTSCALLCAVRNGHTLHATAAAAAAAGCWYLAAGSVSGISLCCLPTWKRRPGAAEPHAAATRGERCAP